MGLLLPITDALPGSGPIAVAAAEAAIAVGLVAAADGGAMPIPAAATGPPVTGQMVCDALLAWLISSHRSASDFLRLSTP